MRLFLVRHGDAPAGFHGVIGGRQGCPDLTDLGRRQAGALRDHLEATQWIQPDVVVSSTLPRAIETAQIIGPGVGLEIASQHDDLIELDPGAADGLTWAEYDVHHGGFDMVTEPDRVFAPEGESWNSFHDRVRRMLERLMTEHTDETVMAVCHAGVIMASMRILLGVPPQGAGAQLRPTNTGLTEWSYEPDGARWTLHCFNATPHLIGLDTSGLSAPGVEVWGARVCGYWVAMDDFEFTVAGARRAAESDSLDAWMRQFLSSPGSDNEELGDELTRDERWWLGPLRLPIDSLNRLAGPPDDPVLAGHIEQVRNSFWYCHSLEQSRVRMIETDPYAIPAAIGDFDVGVLASILLHSRAPFDILEQTAKRVTQTMIVAEAFNADLGEEAICRFLPHRGVPQIDTWWQFSPAFFVAALGLLGFTEASVVMHHQRQVVVGEDVPMFTVVASRPSAALQNGLAQEG